MFSFFRGIYRRTIILILVLFYGFVRRIRAYYDSFSNECKPIRSNFELYEFEKSPIYWNDLTEPLAPRCRPKPLAEHFLRIEMNEPRCEENEARRSKVFVCHDLAGNYRGDRFISGTKKWDDYRFKYWHGVDYFCYFSHNYITIPPLPWINAAHRHGVQMLGTFIVEHRNGSQLMHEVLSSDEQLERTIDALVSVTVNCCFDGWLINIECEIQQNKVSKLRKFLKFLTERIHEVVPNGKVFWYDSVVNTGHLRWQNELNDKNIDFFRDCDGVLLNYGWNTENLDKTAQILSRNPEAMAKVFVGIDVFGRGQTAKYHTIETLQRIKEFNFSVGIFAPAWTFERILDIGLDPFNPRGSDVCNHHFMHRDHLFWTLLWKHMHTSGPVALPFYTSFCLGSGVKKFRDGIQTLNEPWFNLMEQEYQPSVPSVYEYNFDEAYHGGSCVRFISDVHRLRLFCSDFSCENQIVAAFVLKRTSPQIHCQLVLKVIAENGNSFTFIHCDNDAITVGESSIDVPGDKRIAPLKGISLQRVILKLSRRQERLFSTQTQVNNWEAYYFYLKFASDVKRCRIVDVGVSIAKDDGWHERDFLLLGAIHMHEGFEHDEHIVGTSELQINRNNFID